jgi:hypothetical protein
MAWTDAGRGSYQRLLLIGSTSLLLGTLMVAASRASARRQATA